MAPVSTIIWLHIQYPREPTRSRWVLQGLAAFLQAHEMAATEATPCLIQSVQLGVAAVAPLAALMAAMDTPAGPAAVLGAVVLMAVRLLKQPEVLETRAATMQARRIIRELVAAALQAPGRPRRHLARLQSRVVQERPRP